MPYPALENNAGLKESAFTIFPKLSSSFEKLRRRHTRGVHAHATPASGVSAGVLPRRAGRGVCCDGDEFKSSSCRHLERRKCCFLTIRRQQCAGEKVKEGEEAEAGPT